MKAEGSLGVLSKRFLVKLDKVPFNFKAMHDEHGGLSYFATELKLEE